MADNVAVTPGTGATIATDDVSGVQYQRVKLDGGGDGASTPILAGGGVEADAIRVTIASDSTGMVSVDDNGASLTVDDGGSTLSVDDGGGSLTVDGTVAVSGTAAVSVAAGATTIAKAEDAAHVSGDVGVPALAVQQSSPSSLADADGDYAMLQMFLGRLWCSSEVTASAASIGKQEDSISSSGDVGVPALAIQRSAPADIAGNQDYAFLQMSAGRLWASGEAYGEVAHDAADSGNPVKIGAKAYDRFALPSAVAANDRANLASDLFGRLRVVSHPDDIVRLGVYYYHSEINVVTAAADAAASSGGGQFWIINQVGSAVTVRIRKVTFRSQLGSALATPTSPRITMERSTFTGTDSGAAITPALRRVGDASAVGKARTASTGMTIAASAVITSFFPVAAATAVSYCTPAEAHFEPGPEDYIDLAAGEVIIFRQADAGTVADTRRYTIDVVTEEFTT